MSSLEEDLDVKEIRSADPTGFSSPQEAKHSIHEAEAILKLTADYMEGGENLASNFSNGLEITLLIMHKAMVWLIPRMP